MISRISIAAACFCTCLWTAVQARADNFEKAVSDRPRIADSLKGVGGQRPPAAIPIDMGFDENVPAETREQFRDDLTFVGTIQGVGATKLHEQIFKQVGSPTQVDGPTYLRWFASRIKKVGFRNDPVKRPPLAYVLAGPRLWLTQNFTTLRLPQMYRIAVMFHEARHTEPVNDGWPHVRCRKPFRDENGEDIQSLFSKEPLAGEEACDRTPLGAYGTEVIMLKNIQEYCRKCTAKVRQDAGLYGDDALKRIIDAKAKKAIINDLKQ